MSGVKNLRAMFEQKGETSPPDRGRSPGIPWTPSVGGDSPRPLSKVRTNFIAIEKDGRIGLQRESSQDSILSASRKLSGGSSDAPTPPAIKQETEVFGTTAATNIAAKMNLKDQPIPESPRTEVGGSVTAGPSKNTTDPKPQVPLTVIAQPKKLGPDGATNDKHPTSNGSDSNGGPSGKHPNEADHSKDKGKAPIRDTGKTQTKSNHAKAPPRPLATSSKPVAKPSKSPTTGKAPKTPEMPATKPPSKTPDKAPQKEKAGTPRAGATSTKATGSASIKRPPPLQASPASGTGFVKPKPKSPTRPVELPARLTTHTAASGSKVAGGPRQSLSRASGALNVTDSVSRPPSRTSISTATSGPRLNVVKSLKRQNSTINRPRPSLGPPPKQPARDHPPTKKEKEVDEGFLARMTRPTQAFASKTVGKAPTSPPRKATAAPAAKKPTPKSEPHVAKRTTLAHRPKAQAGPSSQQPQPSTTAAQIAIRVEEAETVEEVIEVSKSVQETAIPLAESKTESVVAEGVEKPAEAVTGEADSAEVASSPVGSPRSPGGQADGGDSNSENDVVSEPIDHASDDKINVQVAVQESLEEPLDGGLGTQDLLVSDEIKSTPIASGDLEDSNIA